MDGWFVVVFPLTGRAAAAALCMVVLGMTPFGAQASDAIEGLHDVLSQSGSGRALLQDLEAGCGSADVGLQLFSANLEAQCSEMVGRLLDVSDPRLLVAAQSLRKVPKRLRDDALVSTLVLIDEWASAAADQTLGPRVVDELRKHEWSRDADLRRQQLENRFPLLVPNARATLASVGVSGSSLRPSLMKANTWSNL